MKYTLINGTRDGRFELICYLNGEVVNETLFDSDADARQAAKDWLDKK